MRGLTGDTSFHQNIQSWTVSNRRRNPVRNRFIDATLGSCPGDGQPLHNPGKGRVADNPSGVCPAQTALLRLARLQSRVSAILEPLRTAIYAG